MLNRMLYVYRPLLFFPPEFCIEWIWASESGVDSAHFCTSREKKIYRPYLHQQTIRARICLMLQVTRKSITQFRDELAQVGSEHARASSSFTACLPHTLKIFEHLWQAWLAGSRTLHALFCLPNKKSPNTHSLPAFIWPYCLSLPGCFLCTRCWRSTKRSRSAYALQPLRKPMAGVLESASRGKRRLAEQG